MTDLDKSMEEIRHRYWDGEWHHDDVQVMLAAYDAKCEEAKTLSTRVSLVEAGYEAMKLTTAVNVICVEYGLTPTEVYRLVKEEELDEQE